MTNLDSLVNSLQDTAARVIKKHTPPTAAEILRFLQPDGAEEFEEYDHDKEVELDS